MAAVGRTVVATVSVANTAVPIVAATVAIPGGQIYEIVVQANGTGPVYIGDSTVTAATGFPLKPAGSDLRVTAMGMDLKQLYITSATAGDSVAVLYFQVV